MNIQDKARLTRIAIRDGMDFNMIQMLGDDVLRRIRTVDLHPSNLRMGHSKRLSQMLHRLPFTKMDSSDLPPSVAGQEIVQSAMK